MSFSSNIVGDIGVMYYLRISGIPYIFSNHAIPASWLTGDVVVIDGESYAQSATLLTDKGFIYKNTIQPKAGIGKSSGMSISFKLDALWLDLMSIHIYRAGGARYTLMGDADTVPGDTAIPFDSTSGATPADTLYAGLEAMEVSTVDSAIQLTMDRGKYDSQQRRFAGGVPGALESASYGAWALDHPGCWDGRTVQIWMATGHWRGDTFVPFGASAESSEDKRIFLGRISKTDDTSDTLRVKLSLQPLDAVLNDDVAFRLPTLDVSMTGRLPVDAASDLVTVSLWAEQDPYAISTPLLSSGGYSDAYGMASEGQILDDIAYTINTTMDALATPPTWWTVGTTNVTLGYGLDGENIQIFARLNSPATVSAVFYGMTIHAIEGSVWRIFGLTGTHSAAAQGQTVQTTVFTYTAQRKRPAMYISGAGGKDSTGVRIWYRGSMGPDFDLTPGFIKEGGGDAGAYVRVDGEVFKINGSATFNRYGSVWTYLTTTGRGQLGSRIREHYVEAGDDVPDAVQLVAFPGVALPKAWLYLLEGGSGTTSHNGTYDKGWYGSGAYLDSQWVNESSFENIATERGIISDNLAVGESTPIRELVQGDCIAQGLNIIAGPDGIELIDTFPPGVADAALAVMALDETTTRTIGKGGKGIKVDRGENRLINDCLAEVKYNNGTGEFEFPVQLIDGASVGTYGRKNRLTMKLRAFGGDGSVAVARSAMSRIQSAYKAPYAVIELEVSSPLWWTVKLGDIVTLTHATTPTLSNGISEVTVGRGITALPARVMSITHKYPRAKTKELSSRGSVVLVIGNISQTQTAEWSPSAYCSARTGATCTITARHGGDEGAEFAANELVVLRTYDGSVQKDSTISTAAAGTIVLKATPTIAAPFIIEPKPYTSAILTAQRFDAFGTSGTGHQLDKPSGSDLPRNYR